MGHEAYLSKKKKKKNLLSDYETYKNPYKN